MGPNPNAFPGIPETWSREYQIVHDKMPVYPAISNYRLAAGLKVGDTVHRSYPSTFVAKVMGLDGSYSKQAINDTDEQLVVDKNYETSFYIKELDELQNSLPVRTEYANRSMVAIFNQIDGDILGLYDQFTTQLTDGNMGGTTGNGISLSTANVKKMFFTARKLLQRNNILLDNAATFTGFKSEDDANAMGVAVISPDVYQTLLEAVEGKDTVFGDAVAKSGHSGMFANFNIFVSNALGWSGVLSLPTQPTDGDTLVINGVTITFKSTVDAGVTAGQVKIASTVDLTRANLATFLNAPSTTVADSTNAGYNAVSAANQALLANMTFTNNNTADTLTIKATGKGYVTVVENVTAADAIWTAALQVQHCLFGIANAIDVVIQKEPSMRTKDSPSTVVGYDFITWTACGYKVFNEGKVEMIDAWVRTDAY